MEEKRFFRVIWRINGVALMVLLIFLIGFISYQFITSTFHNETPPVLISNLPRNEQSFEKWTLGLPHEIDGSNFIYIPLESDKKEITGVHSGMSLGAYAYNDFSFRPSRNMLFLNKKTKEMKWLFRDNSQLIERIKMLYALKPYDKGRKVDAVLYQVIRKDTNSDQKLNSDDLADIGVSLPNGEMYKELFQSVERLLDAVSLDGEEILVLYQSKGRGYASTVDLQNMSIKETREIPTIE